MRCTAKSVRLLFGAYGYVVKADIKGFFDNMDHDWLLRMLEQRIYDREFLFFHRNVGRVAIV
jgi:retron-type reverse transcriptase